MPRHIKGVVGTALALAALLAVLRTFDTRVQEHVNGLTRSVSGGNWSEPSSTLGRAIGELVGYQAFDNVFLVSLLAAAIVLVLLMLRT